MSAATPAPVGFIGTGVMGTGIIANLRQAGVPVVVFNRTRAHADQALATGATWAENPAAVAAAAPVIFTMVGFPTDVQQVYFAEDGVFAGAQAGTTLVDLTTSEPALAVTIAETAAVRGLTALDAPVSGGDVGAKNGTLAMMVGGDSAALTAITPLLAHFTASVTRFGGPGAGQHAKMANQIMVAGTMTGLAEMLTYGKAAGLDLPQLLTTVGGGAAGNWSLTNYGPRILAGDCAPGFYVKHFIKDLGIALDAAAKMGLTLPGTEAAKSVYDALQQAGLGDAGTQTIVQAYPGWD